jgi:integrase
MRDEMKKIAKLAGVTLNVFPHRIRHSAAHHLRQNTTKIENIQLFLGHADPGTTASVYARGDLFEIQDQLEGILDISQKNETKL